MRIMKIAATIAMTVLAPIGANAAPTRDHATARSGQTVLIHNLAVTPLRLLEDSRCPRKLACIWAGRLRLAVSVDRPMREFTLGEPIRVAAGQLKLAAAAPDRLTVGHNIPPRAYRFAFEFIAVGGVELTRR